MATLLAAGRSGEDAGPGGGGGGSGAGSPCLPSFSSFPSEARRPGALPAGFCREAAVCLQPRTPERPRAGPPLRARRRSPSPPPPSPNCIATTRRPPPSEGPAAKAAATTACSAAAADAAPLPSFFLPSARPPWHAGELGRLQDEEEGGWTAEVKWPARRRRRRRGAWRAKAPGAPWPLPTPPLLKTPEGE